MLGIYADWIDETTGWEWLVSQVSFPDDDRRKL